MKIKVYQIDRDHDDKNLMFMGYDFTMSHGGIDPSDYKCVFDGNVECSDLEEVFTLCNEDHPIGYNGHSLSVSDIVDVEQDGCYFCDRVGFKKLDDFDASAVEPIEGKRMLVIEPHKAPYEMIIPDNLDALQQAVRGMIEATYPFEDNAFIFSNEEAKLIGMEGNRRLNGEIYAGPMLIAGDDGVGGTMDLTDEQIAKYTTMFEQPEDISPEEVESSAGFGIYGFY